MTNEVCIFIRNARAKEDKDGNVLLSIQDVAEVDIELTMRSLIDSGVFERDDPELEWVGGQIYKASRVKLLRERMA